MNKINFICQLINTKDENYNNYFEDFKMYCNENNYIIKGEGTNMEGLYLGGKVTFWDFVNFTIQTNVEMFWDNLKYAAKHYPMPCIITGELGRWNGTKAIYPTLSKNQYEAISKCCSGADDYEVTVENNVINVTAMHHDGRNYFEVRLISWDAYNKLDDWDGEEDGDIMEFVKKNTKTACFEYFE